MEPLNNFEPANFCPICGNKLNPGIEVCPNCGFILAELAEDIDEPVNYTAPENYEAPVAEPAPAAEAAPETIQAPEVQPEPVIPAVPVAPAAPIAPVAPEVPVAPAIPEAPVAPVTPEAPVAPAAPVEPAYEAPVAEAAAAPVISPKQEKKAAKKEAKEAKKAAKLEAKAAKKAKKSKKKVVLLVVLLLIFLLIIAPVGTYFGTYFLAIKNAKDGNFETADKLLLVKPLTDMHDNILLIYVDAGTLKESGSLNEAALKFYSISSYEDSLELAKECSKKYADKLAKKGKYDEELDWAHQVSGYDVELGKQIELEARYNLAADELDDYRDYTSDRIIALSNELKSVYDQGYTDAYEAYVESQAGVALYYANRGDYAKAAGIINPIKNETSKTQNLYQQTAELIFNEGVNNYYGGEFEIAIEFFDMVSDYSNASSYKAVCNDLRLAATSNDYAYYLKDAFEYYDVPDVGYVIFKDGKTADRFFFGEWRSGSYYYRLEQGRNGNTFYTNIPMIDFNENESFYYKDNVFCAGKNYASATRPCFTFYVSSYYEISIYCEKNGQTYYLYRQ